MNFWCFYPGSKIPRDERGPELSFFFFFGEGFSDFVIVVGKI